MNKFHSRIPGTVMIGVGAVFDYLAGTAYIGPEWAKKIGIRWLLQFFYDPRRYFSRIAYILMKLPKLLFLGHLNSKS
jgi:UDP-N-acetyl-D-mannosaminuronic acid transferase (WecB/TagA/CpsF family)